MYLEKNLSPVYRHVFIHLQELMQEELNNLQYLYQIKSLYIPVESMPLSQMITNLIMLEQIFQK